MIINVFTVDNGVGLTRDACLLKALIDKLGHDCRVLDIRNNDSRQADINIFLEILPPDRLGRAILDVAVPNPEWWQSGWTPYVSRCEVLAKTKDTERIFSSLPNKGVTYIGFTSQDRYSPVITRRREFIHVAGKSSTKGTKTVLAAWTRNPSMPRLTIVQHPKNAVSVGSLPNVTYITDYLNDEDLRNLQNQCMFHLCPSQYEGFGHYINEARSCGAVVLVTNAPPMRDFVTGPYGDFVGVTSRSSMALATLHNVSEVAIRRSVSRVSSYSPETLRALSSMSREAYLKDREDFENRFSSWIKEKERALA